jgi:hypothetical protein
VELIALYAGFQVAPATSETTIGGASLCGITRPENTGFAGIKATFIERAWEPIQFLVLAHDLLQPTRYWITGRSEEE